MKMNERYLELQAHADGELEPALRGEIEQWIAADPEAQAVIETFRSLRQIVRNHEPAFTVPASREFYWSQIRTKFDLSERSGQRASRASAGPRGFWLRWWFPVFGAAAVAIAAVVFRGGGRGAGDFFAVDQGSEDAGAMMFRSESEGVTICWID